MPNLSRTAPLLVAAALVGGTGSARAQPAADRGTARVAASAAALAGATPLADTPARKRKNTIAIGAVLGAAGAAAVTVWAANAYGNNEGNSFCGACFAQWGAIAIPAGAAAGAGIGWALKATASPSRQPAAMPPADTARRLSTRRTEVALTLTF